MTLDPLSPSAEQIALEGEIERVRAELQDQIAHARALLDQSRRLFNAAASEPRSFRRVEA